MTSERWQKVKVLFDEVVELSPDEREKILDRECTDEELRREVESLLASYSEADSFMEKPSVAEVASLIIAPSQLEPGAGFGHYEIIRQIGAGGMGEVYLAQDKELERRVAIKILNEKFSRQRSNLERFIKEAKAVSALNHPNILVIHEIGEADGTRFIVSEFVEGDTLRERINESRLNLSEILEIFIQIANALSAAHHANIIHRDIKPENIIIRPDGYLKVLDFGLAKLIKPKTAGFEASAGRQNETARGVILGTINYMSPEQAKGEKVDERTDIFSLGTVVYEMIAGRTPFAGNSKSETFANLINSEPLPLSRFIADVPDELERIIAQSLKKDPGERYQTMKDVLADLKSWRGNIAFDERMQRLPVSTADKATSALQAATANGNNRTNKTDNNFIGQIKRNKALAALTLLVFMAGLSYYFWLPGKTNSDPEGKKSLAVLPFINTSRDPDAEYLSDGITESVINNLSQISELRVMSRNSAFRFKNDQSDTREIARQLGVETLVTGDIKQLDDKLIVNVRLINAADDSQIWGNQYVKSSSDIIATQNEIAQAVASNLRLKLTTSEQQRLNKRYTENAEAWQLYQRGRYHYFKLTEPEIRKSIGFYQQAIDLDPTYALAYAGIADAYRTLPIAGWNIASKDGFPQAQAAARKALEIDPNLAEAYIVLGWVEFFYDWDWKAAESHLQKTLEINPNNADGHRAYGHFFSILGQHDKALAEIKRARELDPLSLINNALEGQFLFYANRHDEAVARLQKTLDIEPGFWIAHNALGRVYFLQGRVPEAIAAFNKAHELSGGSSEPLCQLAYTLAKSGNRQGARSILEELKSRAPENYVPACYLAMIYNGLGESEEALNYLEKSYEQREVQLSFIKIDNRWDNLRSEPRFIELMKRMNFE